jgi:CheY-like chemotaxis protein
MTANAMKRDRELCFEAGMDDYIAKPISKAGLAELLKKHLPHFDKPETKTNQAFAPEVSQAQI